MSWQVYECPKCKERTTQRSGVVVSHVCPVDRHDRAMKPVKD